MFLWDTLFDICVVSLHSCGALHLSATPWYKTQRNRWQTPRAVSSSTYQSTAHFSVSPRDLLKSKDCLSCIACCMAKSELLAPIPKKYRSSNLEMVKDTAALPFKYKVTVLSLSVWKFIYEDSLARIREKKRIKKKSSRIGNNSLFQECHCSCN